MAKIATLTDPFHYSIDSRWGVTGTGETWVSDGAGGGYVELSVDAAAVRSIYTATTYDLTGSYVFAEVVFPAAGNNTKQNGFELSDSQTGTTNRLRFFRQGATTLSLILVSGGAEVDHVDITYDAVDHRWLRFAESGGTIFWDTSADGRAWTNRHNRAIPSWGSSLTAVYARARAFRSGAEDPSVVRFDNVNCIEPFVPGVCSQYGGTF